MPTEDPLFMEKVLFSQRPQDTAIENSNENKGKEDEDDGIETIEYCHSSSMVFKRWSPVFGAVPIYDLGGVNALNTVQDGYYPTKCNKIHPNSCSS